MDADEPRCEPFTDKRDKIIVRTSAVGIVTNVLLAAFKAAVGPPLVGLAETLTV